MDGVLGDFNCHRWDVHDIALVIFDRLSQRQPAFGTGFQSVLSIMVDLFRSFPGNAWMAFFATGLFSALLPRFFQVRWRHPRWAGRADRSTKAVEFFRFVGKGQDGIDGLFPG